MEQPDHFPFLKSEDDDTDLGPGMKWIFLSKHFSVGKDDDNDFLLKILNFIEVSCPESLSIVQTQRLFDLFVVIYVKLAVAKDQAGMRFKIR